MSFLRYENYKGSEVEWLGEVPAHWKVMPIRLAARLESGHTPSRARSDWWQNCNVPWFTLADIWQVRETGANVIFQTKEMVSELGLANSSARVLPKGTVMLSRTASVGFSAIMGVDMATTQDFANWVCGDSLIPEFLLFVFRAMKGEFKRLMMGSTHNTIYMPDIKSFRFTLPPLDEQLKIIDFLRHETVKMDSLIEAQKRLIELLKEKRQTVILDAVTKGLNPGSPMKDSGVEWLGKLPAHWSVVPLMRLTQTDRPIMYGIVLPGPDVGEGIPILKGGNVCPSRLKREALARTTAEIEAPYARARLRAGDLVYSIRGSIGDCELVPAELEGCNITQDVARIAPDVGIDAEWLRFALLSEPVAQDLACGSLGAAVRGINIFDLKRARLPVPPASERQAIARALTCAVERFDELTTNAQVTIDLLSERRTALISAAVTGKIDVRAKIKQPELALA